MADEDASDVPRLAFGFTPMYDDDIPATCAQCGAVGVQRPHNPPEFIRICLNCFLEAAETGLVSEVMATRKTMEEIAEFEEATRQKGGH